jgi:hypothetical protein
MSGGLRIQAVAVAMAGKDLESADKAFSASWIF